MWGIAMIVNCIGCWMVGADERGGVESPMCVAH